MSIPEPITNLQELQNICILGLPLWVVTKECGRTPTIYSPWMLKDASIIQGKEGPELGSPIITHRHVKIWGIKDALESGTTVFVKGISNLFTTEEDAAAWYLHHKNLIRKKPHES